MRLLIWKLRFSFYMWRRSDMPFKWCMQSADCSIDNDPDSIYEDGPIYYAQEEMACWSD